MAWDNSVEIERNTAGDPVPQTWDDTAQVYKVSLGKNGRPYYIVVDESGNALLTDTYPGVVDGPAAHDAAVSGNPVQVGGVYRSADPSLDDGDIGSVRVNARGEVLAQLTGSIEEHMWLVGDAEPTPTANRAIGLVFDPGTDDVVVKVWTGAAWEVM